MKAAVLGCGAIGGLFLGYLSCKGGGVNGVVRAYQKDTLEREGLAVEGVRGKNNYKVKADTELKENVDFAIFATKTGDLKKAVEENLKYLKGAAVLTTQNGLRAEEALAEYFPKEKIISGIVMFGATFYPPNRIVHNFEGDLILGNLFGAEVAKLTDLVSFLSRGFKVVTLEKIKGAKYLKLFINLNNCIPAALGVSMQEAFSSLECAKLAVRLNKEAYRVVKNSGIDLASLPAYPKERIEGLASMELDKAAAIFSGIISSLSKEPLYGSVLQSIKRGRPSEIDYLNGEIAFLARENNLAAPLNEKIVSIVKSVEKTGKFLTKEELIKNFN